MNELFNRVEIIMLIALMDVIPMLYGIGFAMDWHPLVLTFLLLGIIKIDAFLYALFKERTEDKEIKS